MPRHSFSSDVPVSQQRAIVAGEKLTAGKNHGTGGKRAVANRRKRNQSKQKVAMARKALAQKAEANHAHWDGDWLKS